MTSTKLGVATGLMRSALGASALASEPDARREKGSETLQNHRRRRHHGGRFAERHLARTRRLDCRFRLWRCVLPGRGWRSARAS